MSLTYDEDGFLVKSRYSIPGSLVKRHPMEGRPSSPKRVLGSGRHTDRKVNTRGGTAHERDTEDYTATRHEGGGAGPASSYHDKRTGQRGHAALDEKAGQVHEFESGPKGYSSKTSDVNSQERLKQPTSMSGKSLVVELLKAVVNRMGTDQTPSTTRIRPASEKNFGHRTVQVKDKAGRMAELRAKYNSPEFEKKLRDRQSAQSTYVPDNEAIRKEDYDKAASATEGGEPGHAKYHRGEIKADPAKRRYTPENTDWSSSSPRAHTVTSTGGTVTYGPSGRPTGRTVPKDQYEKSVLELLTLAKSLLSKSAPPEGSKEDRAAVESMSLGQTVMSDKRKTFHDMGKKFDRQARDFEAHRASSPDERKQSMERAYPRLAKKR